MDNHTMNVPLLLLEIIGRKFFNCISQIGDAFLVSKWYEICDSKFDTENLKNFLNKEIEVFSSNNEEKKHSLTLKTNNENVVSLNGWETNQLQPIEVCVDENTLDIDFENLPSTSSSIISSQADTQQDAKVYGRIAELRNAGLWSATRLPICVEPLRPKLHWDFLLEEVLWMCSDFRQERRIKRKLARKLCSEARQQWKKKFDSKNDENLRREQERDAKRTCFAIARMVKEFWMNVDKVVDFRTKEILNSQKRKALDKHLTFLVNEADKLSNLLHERFVNSKNVKYQESLIASSSQKLIKDKEVNLNEMSSGEDDESTIAFEEKKQDENNVKLELNELSKEANLEFDDFLSTLPQEYLEHLTHVNNKKTNLNEILNADAKENKNFLQKSDASEVSNKNGTELKLFDNANLTHSNYGEFNYESSEVRRFELNNIAKVALEFQPKGFTLDTTQIKTEMPFLLRGTLREYQLVGLDWLVTLYEKNLNGILADEMGLGKTIQTVALLAHLACEKMIWGPHLIIVPTSVILNWEMEFKKWCPSLKIFTYFGNAKERAEKRKGWSKNNAFHVCITSYKIASQDIKALKMKAWQYIILDEAQNIKNFKSQRWQTLLNIRSRRRLLLTGTPLQNSLMELWSLLHFLMPSVFSSHEDFKDWFSNPMTNMVEGSMEVNNVLVQRLHKVLRPFILRRLKSEVETQLPTKQEKIVFCALSKRQRYLYNEFLSRKTTQENLQSGSVMGVLNVIMQLRKCCNHPNLFEARPVISPFVAPPLKLQTPSCVCINKINNTNFCFAVNKLVSKSNFQLNLVSSFYEWKLFENCSNKENLSKNMCENFQTNLPKIKGLKFYADQKTNCAPIFLKKMKNMLNFSNGNFFSKSVTLKNERKRPAAISANENQFLQSNTQRFVNKFNSKRFCRFENILANFYNIKRGENQKISQWITFQKRLLGPPTLAKETIHVIKKCVICVDDNSLFDAACTIISNRISNWIQNSIQKFFVMYVTKVFCEGPFIPTPTKFYDRYKHKICELVSQKLYSKQSETTNAVYINHLLLFPELRLIEYDCGKLQILSKLLTQLYDNKHRCLIFTQMSKMLDILQTFLSHHNYKYFRLDGATHIDQRQAMMEKFNNDNSIFCFILSTRSGGVGINLTGADTVIFYDSDWNPTMDAQAQDRCHRIGQTRNVTIYRLISEKTIEENILKKAMEKRRLGEIALDEAEFTPKFFRDSNNIRDLFNNEESVAEFFPSFKFTDQNVKDIEIAMANAEDQQDVVAAKNAQAEATVDVAEFDENSTTLNQLNSSERGNLFCDFENPSEQYVELINSMTPIERYAINFLENEYRPELEEEVKETKALVVAKKEDYLKKTDGGVTIGELNKMNAFNGDSIKLLGHDTYDEEFINEIFPHDFSFDSIPLWMPPSPPNSENGDILNDNFYLMFSNDTNLYEQKIIPDSKLPPISTSETFNYLYNYDKRNNIICNQSNSCQSLLSTNNNKIEKNNFLSTSYVNKSHKHFRRQVGIGNGQHPVKKIRNRQFNNSENIYQRDETLNSKNCYRFSTLNNENATNECILSPPESSPSTPSPVISPANYSSSTASVYDSAMTAVNNIGVKLNAGNTSKTEVGFSQKFDETTEFVRRNNTRKRASSNDHKSEASYVSFCGTPENRFEILYCPSLTTSNMTKTNLLNENLTSNGGFAMPMLLTEEKCDYEGMPWSCEEDYRLLMAVTQQTALKSNMLGNHSALEINWHFVASCVNLQSKQYRTPRKCFIRYYKIYMQGSGALFENSLSDSKSQHTLRLLGVVSSSATKIKEINSISPNRLIKSTVYFDNSDRIRQNTIEFQTRAIAVQNASIIRKHTIYSPIEAFQKCAYAFRLQQPNESSFANKISKLYCLQSIGSRLPPNHKMRLNELGIKIISNNFQNPSNFQKTMSQQKNFSQHIIKNQAKSF